MEEQEIPKAVQKRLTGWYRAFWFFTLCQYAVGVGGVLASAIAAGYKEHSQVAGVISASCIALLAFMKPEERYRKNVVAWRILDEKVNLYRFKLIEIEELLEGMARAENAIDQIERDIARPRTETRNDRRNRNTSS